MIQFVFIICSILCFCAEIKAQPGIDGNSNYSQQQQRNAREWAEKERHYNSMKPASRSSSSIISGNYNSYGWADYSRMNEINAATKRIKAREDEYNAKVQKMQQLLKERNIVLSKENYNQIMRAGLDAGFSEYYISRTYGNYDPNYKPAPDGYYDWSGNYIGSAKPATIANEPARQKPKSLNDLSSSQRQNFEGLLIKVKEAGDLYSKISWSEQALKVFEDPRVQYDLAILYIQKGDYIKARTMLYDCGRNEIASGRPPLREITHQEAYTYLIESYYELAEKKYFAIYSEEEKNKEIICETASANFHIGDYEHVYDIMKNANENNPENKNLYTLAGSAILAIDSSFTHAEKLFSSIAPFEKEKDLKKQIAKKLYDEVQTYRKLTGKITVVTVFLLDLAVMLDPKNIDYRAERYDSNAFLRRSKETTIDEPFLK